MSEKVSVAILAHDRPEQLSESLNSVLEQTHPNVEIIVVGPTSNSDMLRDILSQHGDSVTFCEAESACHGLMMNAALEAASGEFITCLNAGDVFLPEKIELQVNEFRESPDTGLVIAGYQLIGEDDSIRNIHVPDYSQKPILLFLLYGYIFNGSCMMIRRECYDRVGLYKDGLAAENDMWIRLARHCRVGVVNQPLVKQKIQPAGETDLEDVRKATQNIISEAAASIPLEEIFPYLQSHPEDSPARSSAHAAIGAILMAYELYEDAETNFTRARQICPDTSLHRMWLGILSRRTKDYQTAWDYFAGIPADDRFHLDARWAATLTREVQKSFANFRSKLRAELASEYNILLQFTLDSAEGKAYGLTSLLSDIAEEIQLYLCWDVMQVLAGLFRGRQLMKDEWNSKSPQTPDDVLDFYKETESYIFDLAWWHRSNERKQLTTASINICKRNGSQKILDFGCGTGQDGILFHEAGFHITLADLPGKTFNYAKWRVEKRKLDIGFINSDELTEKYDAILCFDVLEHLWEPEKMVRYLHDHLSDDGILLVTTHFGHDEDHPMHLERNDKYLGEEFEKMMSDAGFRMEPWNRAPFIFYAQN